jgi:predicted dehydrogenase
MSVRVAFMGFRHPHVYTILGFIETHDGYVLAGTCEEDEDTRRELLQTGKVTLTHDSYDALLNEGDFSILIVGDYFARRGQIIARALEAGKHVLSDKPICTSLSELETIEELAMRKELRVGVLLELRYEGKFITTRELVQRGEIGEVHSIIFGGQHPLLLDKRPRWYYEEGKQGGTINDLAIHAVDVITWITGRRFTHVNGAREWNAGLPQYPHFRNAAQLMLSLENECGVLGDLTYISPDSFGYGFPLYWRFTFWGEEGVVETGYNYDGVILYRNGRREAQHIPPAPTVEGGALKSLLKLIDGSTLLPIDYSQQDIFRSSRICLKAQEAAASRDALSIEGLI